MSRLEKQIEDQLHAYHMGWLGRDEMASVERLIERSAEVAARSEQLRRTIEPLADWNALPALDGLDAQILRHVQRETGADVVPITEVIKFDAVPRRRAKLIGFPLTMKELGAVAACLVLMAGVLVPSLARASLLAQQRACAVNLGQIGSALVAYGQDFSGSLPYAGSAEGNWLPERTSGVHRFRNSRNRFLLLSSGYIGDASHFVCPADREGIVMRFDDAGEFDDFAERRNCSYDSQLVYDSSQQSDAHPQLVVWSDPNPLFDGESYSGREDLPSVNSTAHRGSAGQNVLRMDGAVSWATSPNVGVQNDNIWEMADRRNFSGSELPSLATDSFMIP